MCLSLVKAQKARPEAQKMTPISFAVLCYSCSFNQSSALLWLALLHCSVVVVHVVIFDVPCVPTFVGVLLWAICAASDCARRVKLLPKPSGNRVLGS